MEKLPESEIKKVEFVNPLTKWDEAKERIEKENKAKIINILDFQKK